MSFALRPVTAPPASDALTLIVHLRRLHATLPTLAVGANLSAGGAVTGGGGSGGHTRRSSWLADSDLGLHRHEPEESLRFVTLGSFNNGDRSSRESYVPACPVG